MKTDYFNEFTEKCKEEMKKMGTANIMIAGKTGVGKSTLINNIFRENLAKTGIGSPVSQHISRITKKDVPLTIYDTKGLELNPVVQDEVKNEILGLIQKNLSTGEEKDFVHILWYCINAFSNRIEDFEKEWIKEFSEKLPVIIVLTQCANQDHKILEKYIRELNLPVKNVVTILAQEMKFSEEYTKPSFGLKELVDITFDSIPEAAQSAFINAQKVSTEKKVHRARLEIIPFVTSAFATGFTPIPFSDAALLVPMQIGMIARLTAIFGLDLDKTSLTAIVTAIGGSGGATALGKSIVANLLKFVPGGNVVGGVISGSTAAILTSALGYAYVEVMSKILFNMYNGDNVDVNEIIKMMKRAYEEQLKKGKSIIPSTNFQR
jgi:uncharacterized protein (DUF697 family)/GTPase SAR1 family protein